eukprot:symbB.v1.2.019791.t1/scaffold1637.1/size108073/1
MFSCKACVPRSDRDADTVRVNVTDIDTREVIERWDKGDGRFVELREGDRLLVGAPTREIADQLVQEWKEQRQGKEGKDSKEASSTEAEAEPEISAAEEEERQERQRKEKEAYEAAELERQKAEEERVRNEAKIKEFQSGKGVERKEAVEEFLKQHAFTDVQTPKRVQEKVLGLPVKSKNVYAIHVAAELADATMVDMLIKEGADSQQKNSAGKTAFDLAKKKAKSGSHDAVLMALRPATARVGGA